MSDTLEVDPEAMRGVIAGMRSKAGVIGARVTGLGISSRRLVDDDWSGEASDAYRARQGRWNTSMAANHSDLLERIGLLERVVERYETAETTVQRLCG